MDSRDLKSGDILQINPEPDTPMAHRYGGMMLIVTEPKSWGAQGFLMSAYDFQAVKVDGRAFLRVKFEDVEYCGRAVWTDRRDEGDDETV